MSYTKHPGEMLTHAEAAHLLIREAQGERLPAVPIRDGLAYRLAHASTLTLAQRADHARRVAQIAAYLHIRLVPPLSA